jgi:hypothetical protein
VSEWNAEKARDLRRYIRMLRRDCDHVRYSCDDVDCCAGPIEKLSAAALGEIERLTFLVQDWQGRCLNEEAGRREAEKRVKELGAALSVRYVNPYDLSQTVRLDPSSGWRDDD